MAPQFPRKKHKKGLSLLLPEKRRGPYFGDRKYANKKYNGLEIII